MVERKEYLQQLLSWKDEQVIKVVTGIRRCGKSTLLRQYQNLLRQQGVAQEQIISINFEDWTMRHCWIIRRSTVMSRNGCSRIG